MKFRNSDILTLLLLTAPAALLQSCTYHDKVIINERHEIVIGVASAGTKSIIDNEDGSERLADMVKQCFNGNGTLKENAGFGVFGFKKVIETSSFLFDNQLVHPDLTSYTANAAAHTEQYTDWVYSPLRFWDLTASYQFIGYWPYAPTPADLSNPGTGFYVTTSVPENSTQIDDTHKQIILHNVPNWQLVDGTENDIMTATSVGRYNPDYSFLGSVRMSFRHVLSQLVVKAYYVGTNVNNTGGVEIQGITLGKSDPITVTNEQTHEQSTVTVQVLGGGTDNTPASASESTDFKQRYDDDNPIALTNENGDNTNTIDLVNSYTLPWNTSTPNKKIEFKDETKPNVEVTPTLVNRWLMIPHKWQKLKMTVDYQVEANTACKSEPVEVTLGAEFDDYKTLPGKKYVITLLLNTSNGSVTVADVAVERWTTHEIERTFYNW